MDRVHIPLLVDVIREYSDDEEIMILCEAFNVEVEVDHTGKPNLPRLAKNLVDNLEHGDNRKFLEALLPSKRSPQSVFRFRSIESTCSARRKASRTPSTLIIASPAIWDQPLNASQFLCQAKVMSSASNRGMMTLG